MISLLHGCALVLAAGLIWLWPSDGRAESLTASADRPRSSWQIAQSDRVSCGYSDNLLLSPFSPLRSSFVEAAAELLFLRSTWSDWEFSAFLQGSHRRYQISDPLVRDETGWFSRVEGRWNGWPRLRLSLALSAFGETSVIDLSDTEASRLVVVARLRGVSAGAAVRFNLNDQTSLLLAARPSRTDYLSFAGDFAAIENRARLEWRLAPRLTAGIDWVELQRDYAARPQYTAGGRPVAGTRLSFRQSGGEASLTLALDSRARRRLTLIAGKTTNQDRASGYFDYRQRRGGLRLDWSAGLWRTTLEGQLKRDVYPVQTGGTGIAPPPRRSQHLEGELRGERMLSSRWTVLATLGREHASGNLAEFTYTANTTSVGLRFAY